MPNDVNTFKIRLYKEPEGPVELIDMMRPFGATMISKTKEPDVYEISITNETPRYIEELREHVKKYGEIIDTSKVDPMTADRLTTGQDPHVEIEVASGNIKCPEGEYLFYRIKHEDKQTEGQVKVEFYPLSRYEEMIIRNVAEENGLSPEDIIAEITSFEPNGRTGNHTDGEIPSYMRQIESTVFNRLVQDSLGKNVKLMYAETEDPLSRLLTEKDFTKFDGEKAYMSYFFKILNT